jgi:choline-sulfatase
VLRLLLMAALFFMACQGEPIPDRPNFVVIVSDALRPDHLGCYGYDRPTSPNIDALAGAGIRFDTAITSAPWTKTSFSSMFTSLHPFQHGVIDWISRLPDTVDVLAAELAREGYTTMCVMNMVGMEGRFGVLRGFAETSVTGKEDRDATMTTDDALDLIAASQEPFLLLVHYFDTHRPYEPPDGFVQLIARQGEMHVIEAGTDSLEGNQGADPEMGMRRQILLYDGCIRYVDTEIGRIIAALNAAGIREQTVVVVTADHGDAFMEHGTFGHGRTLFDEEIRIPLVMSFPGRYGDPGIVAEQVRTIDLAATILDLAHAAIPEGWEGMSLVGLMDKGERTETRRSVIPPDIALTETSMRRGVLPVKSVRTLNWKIIVEPATGLVQTYDLRSDPGETANLWPAQPGPDNELARTLWSVPGATISGWRLAFSGGAGGTAFRASVEVASGGRIIELGKPASRGRFIVRAEKGGQVLRIESVPDDINLLMFETEPENVEVTFTIADDLESISSVHVGKDGVRSNAGPFSISRPSALGLPETFEKHRGSHVPAAFVWWLPGGRPGGTGETLELSPEEQKRLKALGYIQ